MRFSVDIFFDSNSSVKIPLTYRRDIVSLIKEALKIENPNFFELYYGDKSKNKQKPFTFSIYLPNSVKENNEKLIVLQDNKLGLHFSSNDYPFFISVYNGLLKVKNFKLFGTEIKIKHFHLKKEVKFEEKMVFKTFTPILLRDIQHKKGKGYLSHDNNKFIEQGKYTIRNLSKYFLDLDISIDDINFTPIKIKSDIVSLYGGEVGNSGIFMLEAPKEVLKLVYDIGFGAKRSQGFGMIDIVG